MEFEDIAISPPQIQPPDQTTSRFIDRFIRLKTRYWNRGFLIVSLTFIGLIILYFQYQSTISLLGSNGKSNNVHYIGYGMCVGHIPGGVLATVFSAHKVFGISFIISFILHIMEVMNYSNVYLHILSIFCIGMTLAIAVTAYHRIYTFWVPLNKKSLRHVPIILWMMVIDYGIQIDDYLNYIRELQGIVGITWFVLWLIVVSGGCSQSPNRGFILFRLFRGSNSSTETNVVSLRRPTIPWKSICTSMPVIALVLSNVCYAIFFLFNRQISMHSFSYHLKYDQLLSKYTTILLLLTFVLVELIPEITECFSITNFRKIFSCLYFFSMGIVYYLETFLLSNDKLVYFIVYFMPYFSLFGFDINHLDIAPQYSSLLYGILRTIFFITYFFSPSCLKFIFENLEKFKIGFLMTFISLAVAVFYANYGSAELQPWAMEIPVNENQRNMQDEAMTQAEMMSLKKSNQRNRQTSTTNKDSSKNIFPQSVDMGEETYYYDNNEQWQIDANDNGNDNKNNFEFFDARGDYNSEYLTMTDTGQFSGL